MRPHHGAAFLGERCLQRLLRRAHHAAQHTCHGDRRHDGELPGQGVSAALQLGVGPHLLHEADAQRLGPRDHLGAQDHVERMAATHATGEPGRPAPRRDGAELEFGKPDPGSLGRRQAEVAGERKLEPSTQAVSVQGGDGRLLHLLDGVEHAEPLVQDRLDAALPLHPFGQLLQVHADREVFISGGGEDHRADGRIGREPGDLRLELVHVVEAQSVPRGIVVDERDHAPVALDDQRRRSVGCIRHRCVPPRWLSAWRPIILR